jgi:hypothetical protein
MKLSPSLLRVGMKLSDPDLSQTAEPFLDILVVTGTRTLIVVIVILLLLVVTGTRSYL